MSESCAGGSCSPQGFHSVTSRSLSCQPLVLILAAERNFTQGCLHLPHCWRQGWRERWYPPLSCERQAGTLPVPAQVGCVSVQMFLCISSQGFLSLLVEWWSAHFSWWGSGGRDLPRFSGTRRENKLNIQGQVILAVADRYGSWVFRVLPHQRVVCGALLSLSLVTQVSCLFWGSHKYL